MIRKATKIKLLITTGIFPPDIGGPATYVPSIAKALTERGHQATVLTTSEPDHLNWDDSPYPFKVVRMNRRQKIWKRLANYVAQVLRYGQRAQIIRLRRFFQENNSDVVFTFLWLPTVVTTIALRSLGYLPLLIWSVQDDLAQDFGFRPDGWSRRWFVLSFAPERVNHFIGVLRGICRKMGTFLEVPLQRFTMIPNSIELERVRQMSGICETVVQKKPQCD